MKKIQSHILQIRQMLNRNIPSIDSQINTLMDHVAVRSFQKENPEISQEAYKRALTKLIQFTTEQENCAKCGGLETCRNMVDGYYSVLIGRDDYIDLQMKKCHRLEAYEEKKKRQELMKSHKIPKSILKASFDSIELDHDRVEVIKEAIDYCGLFSEETPKHGLYLYGSFGVGKSHIAAAMANYLTEFGIDSFMIYFPDFVQELYNSIKEKTTSELIESVKRVKVLIIDDIGAENLNPWVRDEVLGATLQERVGQELPTIFTSNLTLDELEQHLSYTTKGGSEPMKARRIMERIRHYVKPLVVKGTNRRRLEVF